MRKEYDFFESTKSPYAKQLKRQATIRLGMPYHLINLVLRD
jgi:hypothetical protein